MIRRNLVRFIMALGASALVTVAILLGRVPPTGSDGETLATDRNVAATGAGLSAGNAVRRGSASGTGFVGGEYDEWALTDPDGFLAHVRSQDVIDDDLLTGLLNALIVAPGQTLELAGLYATVEVEAGLTLEEAAATAIAEDDVTAALAYLDALPEADSRYRRIRGAVAEGWARQDPNAALDWAEALQPPAPGVIAIVIGVTAESDIEAALDMYAAYEEPPGNDPAVRFGGASAAAIARTIVRQIGTNAERERIADELLRDGTPRSLVALKELTGYWAEVDSAAATGWVARSATRLPPALPAELVGGLAAMDPAAAASFADRLPVDMQLLAAEPIARGLALRDPTAAVRWIEKFKAYPAEYRNLYMAGLRAVAATDPATAAAMLAFAPPAIELRYSGGPNGTQGDVMPLEGEVAVAWARKDISAASAWVQGISDPAGRKDAAADLADYWLTIDPQAAQRWLLNLPEDDARQAALDRFLSNVLWGNYETDPGVVRAFGLETERQELLSRMILNQARSNPGDIGDHRRALALAREWISDPDIRQQTIQQIEAASERYSLTAVGSN